MEARRMTQDATPTERALTAAEEQFERLAGAYGFDGDRATGGWLLLRQAIRRLAADAERAVRARAPDVERLLRILDKEGADENTSEDWRKGINFAAGIVRGWFTEESRAARAEPPETGLLWNAAQALVDEWDAARAGDMPLNGHYQKQALDRLRAALEAQGE
jgi:hypothetical protein